MGTLLRSLAALVASGVFLAAVATDAAGKTTKHLKQKAGRTADVPVKASAVKANAKRAKAIKASATRAKATKAKAVKPIAVKASVVKANSVRANTARTSGITESYTDSGPEPILARVFDAIEANKLELAMQQTDTLIKAYPNFRLAHLVRGDLLLARSRALTAFGEGGGPASGEKVADLRDEAIVRLKSYRIKPPTDYVPRYLLQMNPEQKHAVVVDTQKSRLYLYQNDNGTPRFVADYYISQGKRGADKTREGDRKTPIGVYHVTSSMPRQKLGDFYGSGAFPINYPNDWDKRQGRDGHGIWLHGTPSNTFSRPPKASDGCVVLANQDLDALSKSLQIGLTPVIISNSIEWLSLDDWQSERTALLKMIEEWRQDWESLNVDRYATHYSHRFNVGGQGYQGWIEHKRKVNAGKSWIKMSASNISMFRNPGKEEYVVVTFDQDYRSSNLSGQMKKRQYWIKESGHWKIVFEGAA